MVAKKKKSRQVKRAEARKAVQPAGPPTVTLKLSLEDTKLICGGLQKLSIEMALPLLTRIQQGMQAALTLPQK